MSTEPPQTPDVDLPGQEHDQADLDIVVEPEPADGAAAGPSAEGDGPDGSSDDPDVTNTLIRPENS